MESTIAQVPSVLPPSTTMILSNPSRAVSDSVGPMAPASLSVGMMTVIVIGVQYK
jgi:hypothetical protein